MPRMARVVIPGIAHHITQRGNNKQQVFDDETDCQAYCQWINFYAHREGLDILAFCLMPNHVHLIAIPENEDSLARAFHTAHMRYSQYLNKKRDSSGHLWQGRFYSCALDDSHLYRAIRYVEQNPVRAGMVKRPWEFAWSSARWHLGLQKKSRIFLKQTDIVEPAYWKEYLGCEDKDINEEIRQNTKMCLALGERDFISAWEIKLGRSLLRKRKNSPSTV